MSSNQVPPPPNPFGPLYTSTLTAGTDLHRIYSKEFAGNAFNPSHKRLNRFSPIFDRGDVVPVMYAASTREGAIYETLFHDAHIRGSRRKSLPARVIERKRYGTWVTQRDFTLVPLHAPDLARFGLTLDQLTATNAMYYPQTARWAEAIHNADPHVDGLEWTSYRGSPATAYVLFGNRVRCDDLAPAGNEVWIAEDAALYENVLACGLRVGVRVHRGSLP